MLPRRFATGHLYPEISHQMLWQNFVRDYVTYRPATLFYPASSLQCNRCEAHRQIFLPLTFFLRELKYREILLQIADKFPEGFNVAETLETKDIAGYEMTRIERGLSNFGFGICKKGHIISIAVLDNYRRLNIAKRLMEAAHDALRLRDVREVYLEVRESNQAAINLYQKLGYNQHKISKHYYNDGESAIIMVAKI